MYTVNKIVTDLVIEEDDFNVEEIQSGLLDAMIEYIASKGLHLAGNIKIKKVEEHWDEEETENQGAVVR
jgi:hypothetical protein